MLSLHVPINIKPLAVMKKENVVRDKSYRFAMRIVKLHLFLSKDFINRLSIAYKEARETSFWIKLLRDTDIIEKQLAQSFLKDCDELLRILYTIINTSRTS